MKDQYDVITLSDNKEYVVVSQTELDGVVYLYLVESEDNNNNMICKFENNSVERVVDVNLLGKLILIFNEELKGVLDNK